MSLFFDEKVKTISTQTRLALNQNEGIQIPIKHSIEIPVKDVFSEEGERILSFLSNQELKNLRTSFEINKIDSNSRIHTSRNKEAQVRIASNYKKYNNVYKSWNKKIWR